MQLVNIPCLLLSRSRHLQLQTAFVDASHSSHPFAVLRWNWLANRFSALPLNTGLFSAPITKEAFSKAAIDGP
jgi:hypothetical protein